MWSNSQETADLVTFTEEILNGKLHFLRSEGNDVRYIINIWLYIPDKLIAARNFAFLSANFISIF